MNNSIASPGSIWIAAVTASSLVALLLLLRSTRPSDKSMAQRKRIPSPRDTLLPSLSRDELAALPYSPDYFPGARDVDTPYGVMRVYEWGPEDGRKVLLIHGDTTPAPMFGPIAMALVQRRCRVMLIDLWGRGYSDTPLGVPHDATLFSMQLLFATASSPLPWTGAASGGFSLIAFSLGSGVAMSFASHFPYLVNAIILLAPAGFIRRLPEGYESKFLRYPTLIPFTYLRRLVGKILGVDLSSLPVNRTRTDRKDHMAPEVPQVPDTTVDEIPDVPAIVQWQFDNHQGFVHSFINTIRYGPIKYQHSEWRGVCKVIKGEKSNMPASSLTSKLFNSKILVLLGDEDEVVVAKDVSEDLEQMLGQEHVEFKTIAGGHGFPVPRSEQVVKYISEFWGLDMVN